MLKNEKYPTELQSRLIMGWYCKRANFNKLRCSNYNLHFWNIVVLEPADINFINTIPGTPGSCNLNRMRERERKRERDTRI